MFPGNSLSRSFEKSNNPWTTGTFLKNSAWDALSINR